MDLIYGHDEAVAKVVAGLIPFCSERGDGLVHLWGLVGSEEERKALLALAESVPGVDKVSDEMISAY